MCGGRTGLLWGPKTQTSVITYPKNNITYVLIYYDFYADNIIEHDIDIIYYKLKRVKELIGYL